MVYSLSFCASDSEKIPLWYLYSGINGKGARLRITKGKFNILLKTPYVLDDTGKNYTIEHGYIYYVKEKDIKYRNNFLLFQAILKIFQIIIPLSKIIHGNMKKNLDL